MTSSPWLKIELADYEGHMSTPQVGQAELLAVEFRNAVERTKARSISLIGCAGGNGLDALIGLELDQVVCVDINSAYLSKLSERYKERIRGLKTVCSEIERFSCTSSFDLVFGGLVFEYTRLEEALRALSATVRRGGILVALLQMKSSGVAVVSTSPYAKALADVGASFVYVDPDAMSKSAVLNGFHEMTRRVVTLESGKSFTILEYERG